MAVKTFEREVKTLANEFTNIIENYNFSQYDFHSIRQTLQDYIERTYPNYNDYFRSDAVMMLIELFAFYGEMMAYRVDMNMNEAFLSTAKDRRNVIKIADMLGYKYNRIEPSVSINRIDISDVVGGSRLLYKKRKQGSINDILSKSTEIVFEPIPQEGLSYYPYKLDYLFKSVTAEDFMNTLNNIFKKLENFKRTDGIKVRKIVQDNTEYFERSIFVNKFQMRFNANENVFVDYLSSRKMFEIQSLKYDDVLYFNTDNTLDALTYDGDALYNDFVELGFEFVLQYDKGNNILDKHVYIYLPVVQGGTFSREIEYIKAVKNFKEIGYEKNIFNNKTIVRQFDEDGVLLRTYHEVDSLTNHNLKYAYEINNTPEGFVELIFGDGKNAEILLPAYRTVMYYRKNVGNSDEIFNVKNAAVTSISLPIEYWDANIEKTQNTSMSLYLFGSVFNAVGGLPAESNEQIKYMAKKIRSVQDRFVTARDYETAGMLHPRVRYSTVLLRTYIGKNSSRMSNEYLDVYFDAIKNNVSTFKLVDQFTKEVLEYYLIVPPAYFTESTVQDKFDYIKFVETGDEYFFEIFDAEAMPANEWFKYPADMIERKGKGSVIRLTNKIVDAGYESILTDKNKINNILPFNFSIETLTFVGNSNTALTFFVTINDPDLTQEKIYKDFDDKQYDILKAYNALIIDFNFTSVVVSEINKGYSVMLRYNTKNVKFPEKDLSFIWTHFKADDIFINPSKSNIIEIYVTGVRKDLKRGIELFEPLTSSESNKLLAAIEKRKMISDIVQVYNASVFEVEIAIRVYKSEVYTITDELLKSKIDMSIDKFFDIGNIPLGTHFYLSRLIEWLHKNVKEIQHIDFLKYTDGSNLGRQITPSSTIDSLGERVMFTQVVEKIQILNGVVTPQRRIEIV